MEFSDSAKNATTAGSSSGTDIANRPSLMGFVLTTHRSMDLGPDAASYFQYEDAFAALSVAFFRSTVCFGREPLPLRLLSSSLLAYLAYHKYPYELIAAAEIFSYAVPYFLFCRPRQSNGNAKEKDKSVSSSGSKDALWRVLSIVASAIASALLSHLAATGELAKLLSVITPQFVFTGLEWLFPVSEMVDAYNIMVSFAHPVVLRKQIDNLLFVTFHIQVGMGFLGIQFLRSEQDRRNQLVRMDMGGWGGSSKATDGETGSSSTPNGKDAKSSSKSKTESSSGTSSVMMERSVAFRKAAAPFILFTALPYMIQIIVYGCVNKFVFQCLKDDLHRTVRLNELFDHDNHLIAMANDSPTSPEGEGHTQQCFAFAANLFLRFFLTCQRFALFPRGFSSPTISVVHDVTPFCTDSLRDIDGYSRYDCIRTDQSEII